MTEPMRVRTMRDLAQEALDVQDACNLSGVVHSWSRAITDLRALLEDEKGFSTQKLNTHPVNVLFASKVDSLVGYMSDSTLFGHAYEWAKDQTK